MNSSRPPFGPWPRPNLACWLSPQAKWPDQPDQRCATHAQPRGHHGLGRRGGAGGGSVERARGGRGEGARQLE
jgi:hypothetical protein